MQSFTTSGFSLRNLLSLFIFCFIFAYSSNAQDASYIIKGRIVDKETNDPIPFVNVLLKDTQKGTTTDFDGYYTLKLTAINSDTIFASYLGYETVYKKIDPKKEQQTVNFFLSPDGVKLSEVTVYAGENPAYEIIRRARRRKEENNKDELAAYDYESYSRLQIDVNNLNEKLRKKKIMRKITSVLDSIGKPEDEEGNPIVPVFLSESISRVYFRNNPLRKSEKVAHLKVKGLGVSDGSLVSQLLSTAYQDYNFYEDYIVFINKNIPSPLGFSWKYFYEYTLIDSMNIGNDFCYMIDVEPIRKLDAAFTGTLWITKNEYALRQIEVKISKEANLNFIESIRIQQQLLPIDSGKAWLPSKIRTTIKVANMPGNTPGMLVKSYISNQDFVLNQPKPLSFYDEVYQVAEDAQNNKENFWAKKRHDSLSASDKMAYKMIDTLNNLPQIKTYIDVVEFLMQGYKPIGKYIEIGPYINSYAFNNIEGHRIRVGFRTTPEMSKMIYFRGYAAYGTRDERLKYELNTTFILSRKKWTTLTLTNRYDLDQVALIDSDIRNLKLQYATSFFGRLDRKGPYMRQENQIKLAREVVKGITPSVAFRYFSILPEPEYIFSYYTNENQNEIARNIYTSEAELGIHIGKDEKFFQNGNERRSLGHIKRPLINLRYVMGVSGVAGSQFNYHKLFANITHKVRLSVLGNGILFAEVGYIPSTLPYPLLKPHLGNESIFLNSAAFNLIRQLEFVSDKYATVKYQQYFEGFLTNSIPVVKRFNLRLVATAAMLYGTMSRANKEKVAISSTRLHSLDIPYFEVSYGVENIFRLVRIDAIHRLTHLKNPNIVSFAIKMNVHFKL